MPRAGAEVVSMSNKWLLVVFALCFTVLLAGSAFAGYAGATKYQEITVEETAGENNTYPSYYLNITYDSDMQTDFSDIRFWSDNTFTQELPYWMDFRIQLRDVQPSFWPSA